MSLDRPRASIIIRERDECIEVDQLTTPRELTPWQARYLAAKLYRLARRVRARTEVPND